MKKIYSITIVFATMWNAILAISPPVSKLTITGRSGENDTKTCGCKQSSDAPGFANCFNEDPSVYSAQTVVFVYDFNPDISKRGLYRIEKVGDQLSISRLQGFVQSPVKVTNVVYFKVFHLNRFMYEASVNSKSISYSNDPPLLFNRLFLGDEAAITKLLDKAASQSNETAKKMTEELAKLGDNLTNLKLALLDIYNPSAQFNQAADKQFDLLYSELKEIWSLSATLKEEKSTNESDLNDMKADLKKMKDSIKLLKADNKRLDSLVTKKQVRKGYADSAMKKNNAAIAAFEISVKSGTESIKEKEADIEEIVNALAMSALIPTSDQVARMLVLYRNAIAMNLSWMSGPLDNSGDEIRVHLKVKSRHGVDTTFGLPAFEDSIVFEIPVRHQSKLTFGTGIFVGGITAKGMQHVNNYAWQAAPVDGVVTDSAKYSLQQSGKSQTPLGFTAMANYNYFVCPKFSAGLSAGAGITLENNPRTAYMLGLNLALGSKRQMIFSAGWMGMNYKVLNDNLKMVAETGTQFDKKPASVDYHDKFMSSIYFSVTYAFLTAK